MKIRPVIPAKAGIHPIRLGLLVLFVFPALVRGYESENTGRTKEPASYLNLGLGARPAALGKAFTSISDDASGVYWNPAGLAGIRQYELQAMSSSLGMDRKFYFLAAAGPVRIYFEESDLDNVDFEDGKARKILLPFSQWNLSVAVGAAVHQVFNIDRRDDFGVKNSEFSNQEHTYFFSLGHDVLRGLSLGYTFRYHVQRLENSSAKGGGFDVGGIYRLPFARGLKLGLSAVNVGGGEMKWKAVDTANITDNYEEQMPRKVRMGASYNFKRPDLLLALDVHTVRDQKPTYHGGLEYKPLPFLALRGGLDQKTPAAGAGFAKNLGSRARMFLDYSFTLATEALQETHRFALLFRY